MDGWVDGWMDVTNPETGQKRTLVRIEPKTDGTSAMLHPFSSLKFQRFDSLYPI